MKHDRTKDILRKFLSGHFPPETEERVQKWIIRNEKTTEKEEVSVEYWNTIEYEADAGTYAALDRVSKRTGQTQSNMLQRFQRFIPRVAAVLIPIFIIIGGYVYFSSEKHPMIEISVAYGEDQHLFLPDSTEVWLNSGTTIRYSDNFNRSRRILYLDGEAWFSVTKDEERPFIVEAPQLTVKVLGTQFNVKAYSDDERSITTLENGKVEITVEGDNVFVLQPNEQLSYDRLTHTADVINVLPYETGGWKTGQLIFSGSTFEEMISTLERRFNIVMVNHSFIPKSRLFHVKFLNNETPDEIFTVLGDIAEVTFERKGDGTVHITR